MKKIERELLEQYEKRMLELIQASGRKIRNAYGPDSLREFELFQFKVKDIKDLKDIMNIFIIETNKEPVQ